MSDFIKRIPHSMHELAVHIFCHTIWQHYYCNFNQNDIDFVIMIVLIYISMIILKKFILNQMNNMILLITNLTSKV